MINMDTQKALYSLLKEIQQKHEISKDTFGISMEEFGKLVESALDKNLIENAHVIRNGKGNEVWGVNIVYVRMTLEGEKYLSDNSGFAKVYNALKEIKDWIK